MSDLVQFEDYANLFHHVDDYNFVLKANIDFQFPIQGNFYRVHVADHPIQIKLGGGSYNTRSRGQSWKAPALQKYDSITLRSDRDQEVVLSLGFGEIKDSSSEVEINPHMMSIKKFVNPLYVYPSWGTTLSGNSQTPIDNVGQRPYTVPPGRAAKILMASSDVIAQDAHGDYNLDVKDSGLVVKYPLDRWNTSRLHETSRPRDLVIPVVTGLFEMEEGDRVQWFLRNAYSSGNVSANGRMSVLEYDAP